MDKTELINLEMLVPRPRAAHVDSDGATQLSSDPLFHPNHGGDFMTRVRCITEMGMGVDVHGRDATKAARRAVSDAIRHSSLGFFRMLGKTSSDMFVDVTIGVPDPGAVDTSAVAKELPYGTVTVTAVKGGLEIPAEQGGDAIIIANAAVIVSLDDGGTG
jgi:uncharacterized protein (TIGR02058 family)